MRAFIWASSGPKIGGGHVSRCRVLKSALELFGCDVDFGSLITVDSVIDLLKQNSYDFLIIDDYSIDHVFEQQCRQWVKYIVCIDDLVNRRHDCDLLLDSTPGQTYVKYQSLVPHSCKLLLGSQYALVASEFIKYRPRSLEYRQSIDTIEKIIVSFGATDPDDWSSSCLEALAPIVPQAKIHVALTDMAPHLNHVRKVCDSIGATLHINNENIACLMAEADLAIGACGGSSWERCCLGLPSIVGIIAPNQTYNAKALSEHQSAIVLSGNRIEFSSKIFDAVSHIRLNHELYKKLSVNAANLCDGNGARRVAKLFMDHFK